MKEHRDMCKPQSEMLTDYEMQRQQRLKRNAELMVAKGKGDLAAHIYNSSQAFLNAYTAIESWDDRDFQCSDEDNDDGEHVVPQNDDFDDEICSLQTRSKTKVSLKKSGSMATFFEYTAAGLPQKQHNAQRPCKGQLVEKLQNIVPFTKTSEQDVDRNEVTTSQNNGGNQPEKHVAKSIQKQQQKEFCRPGSLSAFRELRKKQSRNLHSSNQMEGQSNHEMDNECVGMGCSSIEASIAEKEQQCMDQ